MTQSAYHWEVDETEAAENAVAPLIGFRANPQRGSSPAISMMRGRYNATAWENASIANGEKTREQLEALSAMELGPAMEFIAFSTGYLAARMFHPHPGDGPVLSRVLLPDEQPVEDAARKDSLERAQHYLPAISELHDNRAASRNSRFVCEMLGSYLAVLIEDPRQTTLDTLLRGYEEPDIRRGVSGFSARQVAEALERSRLWSTLGWRRGMAERRFRWGPRNAYLENIAGDVRVLFNPEGSRVSFADIRRLRVLDVGKLRDTPAICDDEAVALWIDMNCTAARHPLATPGR